MASMEPVRDIITTNGDHKEQDEEETQAAIESWNYVFGFTAMAVVKCAIDLGIADLLEEKGGSMSFTELVTSLNCPPTYLNRIMRFLVHRKIFSQKKTSQNILFYSQTPLSRRLLLTHGKNSLLPLMLLEISPVMLSPWLNLSKRVEEKCFSAFDTANGEDVWSYAADHPSHSKLINDAMACDARIVVNQIVEECPNLLDGVSSVVDVGGGDGTTLSILVKAFPWINGINFDLDHVVSVALPCERVENVAGNMFECVPKADVVLMKWVLHDWGDEECIQILKKCKEAITKDKGKLLILEAVIAEEETEDKMQNARLLLDMVMMAHTTNGKERTLKEWEYVLINAGFSHFNVKPIHAVQSIIEAFP